ncbi:hypothetical protein [Bosea sp. 124]|uniref:hypothetical protein n=1 Tax=Bosea sp. 124 TaxID=2135642 RepID=UPI000D44F74A|nr:hypothetical protein [Bosea sp. 124]PTM40123.1 hypothetical protein C8D03_1634 [Bosea sp. 124]
MKRPAILLGSIAIALHLHSPGHAQDGGMNGVWRQIRSNAGECHTCQIEIGQADTAFAVTANNGWSANVRIDQADDTRPRPAVGVGDRPVPAPTLESSFDFGSFAWSPGFIS